MTNKVNLEEITIRTETHELSTAANLYTRYGFRLTEEKGSDSFGKSVIQQRYDLFLQ